MAGIMKEFKVNILQGGVKFGRKGNTCRVTELFCSHYFFIYPFMIFLSNRSIMSLHDDSFTAFFERHSEGIVSYEHEVPTTLARFMLLEARCQAPAVLTNNTSREHYQPVSPLGNNPSKVCLRTQSELTAAKTRNWNPGY